MKKLLLLGLALILFGIGNATVFYVSPTGSDATGTGTAANPWKSLYKAVNSVSTPGDIIHITAGTYVETQKILLKVGVSIEGEGVSNTIISSTLTADWTALLSLTSPEGTNGNQHISNLKFDGRNLATFWGIEIRGRSNVEVHHIQVDNFKDRGVIFAGRNDGGASDAAPGIFATGNLFHDNVVNNSAAYNTANGIYGRGNLCIGGQNGILVYNNTITQNQRPNGYNGWCIKYENGGYNRNMKIYNNTITKIPYGGTYPGENGWDFAIEFWATQSGCEIYNNQIIGGAIDIDNAQDPLGLGYSIWIHDNTIYNTVINPNYEDGIILETSQQNTIVENNIIYNKTAGITFTTRYGTSVNNVHVRKNLIYNIGRIGDGNDGKGIAIGFDNGANSFRNVYIRNNTIVAKSGMAPWFGFKILSGGATLDNIYVQNNIIQGFLTNGITNDMSGSTGHFWCQNNNLYLNGNSNNPVTPLSSVDVVSGNLKVSPLFVGGTNYTLQASSPMIDKGINVGLPYSGSAPDIGYAEYASGGNVSPAASAGVDQTITLPTSSVTLTGSGTDPDGTIASYAWTKVSGPAGGTIASPAAASTNITGLTAGTYVFRLTVTDNLGATGTDDIQIIVNPAPNQAPTANAGADQTITLPTSSVTLTGSGTDPDGTIASYAWTKVSGPAVGAITSPSAASTTVTGLTMAGTYVYRLTVTDNGGATKTDDVQIIVNSAANQAPTANAGADQTITLPASTATLTGSGTDPDGTIASYAWTKVSGPAGGAIGSPATASTGISGLTTAGTYVFRLTVTDNAGATASDDIQIIVNSAPNQAPTANAGANQTITLPTSSVTFTGSGTDPDGTIASYAWTKVSGPAGGTITSPAAATTTVTGLTAGTYVYRLTVTDNSGATATDDVQVIVNSAPPANVAPTANAGANQTITLPTSSVTFTGSGTDPDGTIASYAWTKVSGPAGGTITSPSAATTTVTGLTAGTYVYRLTVTDNAGATGTDDVQVIVNSAPPANVAPTANAGADQTITLPTSSVTLTGSGTDPDGTIASYAWTKVSGPAGGTIGSPSTASTGISGLTTAGTYVFRLTVTDNAGATATDDVQIIVNSAPAPAPVPNQAPTANAGADQSITLPTSSTTLNGSGTDPDGTIYTYTWTKVSGPAGDAIGSPTMASTGLSGLTAGTYIYRLTVTDNGGATGTDDIQITVYNATAPVPAPDQPPVADAGNDASFNIPNSNSAKLDGTKSYDPDGSITKWAWNLISGPAGSTITNSTTATPGFSATRKGTYLVQLMVTDNAGKSSTDQVSIVVTKSNRGPRAMTTYDTTSVMTQNTLLEGSPSFDADGSITAYKWSFVSGPSKYKILNPDSANTVVANLAIGTYQFALEVMDDDSAIDKKLVTVLVKSKTARREILEVKLHPNPAVNDVYITVDADVQGRSTLTLYDVKGAPVYKEVFDKTSFSVTRNIKVGGLRKGTYFVVIQVDNSERMVKKLMVL